MDFLVPFGWPMAKKRGFNGTWIAPVRVAEGLAIPAISHAPGGFEVPNSLGNFTFFE